MLSRASVKILKTMFNALPEPLHLREISRRAKISSETAHRLLNTFVKDKLMFFEERGNEKVFHLNLEDPFLPKYYELIKGREAEQILNNKEIIREARNKIIDTVTGSYQSSVSILLLSQQPLKVLIVLDNDDYNQSLDKNENLLGYIYL